MDSYDILVIILSILLLIFLVVAIIALIAIIRLVKKVELITDRAQATAENVSEFASKFRNAASLSAFGAAGLNFIKAFKRGKK